MIYIDANIFIYALAGRDGDIDTIKSKRILVDVRSNKIQACTTILTWDEVFYFIKRHIGEADAINKGKMLISFPNLSFIEINKKTIVDAQSLCENYHLDPRDAIHGACALSHCSGAILSNDGDFDSITGISRSYN
jgi:predicted nucleic acid-binding protein